MDHSGNATLNARITAIEDDSLVLKLSGTGDVIRWPLANIPKPFEVSQDMSLELHSSHATASPEKSDRAGATTPDAASNGTRPAKSSGPGQLSDEEKRRLLESLIN
ncbi:MAG TPA: hypothetical protein VI588_01555 [Candidatus Gracilibacteria bacterium]|nr:hypothetical protein [Candidatus Gracilibacteria bacterium]